ncbi:hypothetical protein ASE94_06485 [Devosia sp. Leaf64]|nr:hypothetical protein ASE94_06485 [Devosia sp. Leaf64]
MTSHQSAAGAPASANLKKTADADGMSELLKNERRSGFTDQHAAMIDAIKSGNWNGLGDVCEADIRASQDLVFDILPTEDGASAAS